MTERHPVGQYPTPDRIAHRYGAGTSRSRIVVLAAGAAVVAALVGWFVWAVWVHSHPKVGSSMDSWELVGDNAVKVTVEVNIYDATAHPTCSLQAYAEDHSTVGTHSFTPIAGRQTITLRTERAATSVDWLGCTAVGQKDPQ